MMHGLFLALLSTVPAQEAVRTVTFNDDIAPIIVSRCASCHRPGEAAPFAVEARARLRRLR